ncbi:uncharacterized protein F5147DRAFT_758075 [Suillus discolor]|uniref:Uncharacterized protein n=1 Tax=Suillus discolor TaxID=1912936 RepID=A0A9P7JYK5_9AGAM|nr:uncharacterized protein F5147DRAFT_758075 [Suillus discolor]KAG2116408.1 hypothetical protein F5147DRAFT_758075 [Suillus discolor]
MPKTLPAKQQRTSETTKCSLCTSHLKKCEKRGWEQREDEELAEIVRTAEQTGIQSGSAVNPLTIWAAQDEGNVSEKEGIENNIDMQGSSPCRHLLINFNAVVLPDLDTPDLNHPDELPQAYELDDIKVEYHPHSKLPSVVHHFADFSCSCSSEGQFQKDVVSVEYDNETHEFEMHYHPLWDWFVHFINEPWTADAFWNAQSQLLPDAKLLVFILYADTNKLSTFGTVKGYPIVAHIANLPVHIHNGNTTLGGGHIVGWLPIVAEDQKHTRKKSFVDFKNAVWHKSFYQLLKSIELHSKNGYWFECGDQTQHRLWPLILILSRDYEEHFDAIPRWPNLTHFKAVMSVNFNDGLFHKDISKDVLLESKSKIGYLLLRCIHYYLELNIYASFKVHTEETIVAGRATLVTFLELMDISFSDAVNHFQ